MYIPSGILFKVIQSEQYGVWAEKFEEGKEVALIIKASSSTMKAIVQGCSVTLFIGLIKGDGGENYLAMGIKIYDSQDSPLLIPMVSRLEFELCGIKKLLEKQSFVISLYDEMDGVICSANGKIEAINKELSLFNFLENKKISVVKEFGLANSVIDSFCYEVDPTYGTKKKLDCNVCSADIVIENIKSNLYMEIDENSNIIQYEISDQEEGLTQEKQLKHRITTCFDGKVFHSPEVKIGKKKRELTDILVSSNDHCLLIESKATSVNQIGINTTYSKRQASLIKNTKKALRQLEGGIKALQRGENISNPNGAGINIIRNGSYSGIVLLSDFMATNKWDEVVEKIYSIYEATKGMIHVMDMNEFVYFLKLTQESSEYFFQKLIGRFNAFYETGNIYIKCIDSSIPMNILE